MDDEYAKRYDSADPDVTGGDNRQAEVTEVRDDSFDLTYYSDNGSAGEGHSGSEPPRPGTSSAGDSDDIPDLTQEKMHKIPHLVTLLDAYRLSYAEADMSTSDQIELGKTMVLKLLKHYFPSNQGFKVVPHSFSVMAAHGWSIPCKKSAYHHIPPENVIGFCVQKEYEAPSEDNPHAKKWYTHCYLALMIDDLATFETWLSDKDANVNRGDILSYSYGVTADIASGIGIIIVGDHIEFYKYDLKSNRAKDMTPWGGPNWRIDLSEKVLVNQYLEYVAESPILYKNGGEGIGANKRFKPAPT